MCKKHPHLVCFKFFFCLFLSNTDTIGMLKLFFEGLCKHVGALPVRSGSVSGIKCLTSLKAMHLRLRFTVSYVLILARVQFFIGVGVEGLREGVAKI